MIQFGIRNSEFGIGRLIPHSAFPIPHSIRWWGALLGLVMAIGLAKVTLATVMWGSAYAAGERAGQLHDVENETQWLQTEVVALQAPRHLVTVMAGERTPFRARVELPSTSARRLVQAVDE